MLPEKVVSCFPGLVEFFRAIRGCFTFLLVQKVEAEREIPGLSQVVGEKDEHRLVHVVAGPMCQDQAGFDRLRRNAQHSGDFAGFPDRKPHLQG